MPIRKGSISCSRFLVEGGVPKDVKKWLTHALKKSAFEPIDPKGDEERAAGFVELEDENATTFGTGLFEGEHALFAWRVDKIRIPGATVRAELAEFAKKYEAKNGRAPSRGQKTEQKELIRRGLRSKTPAVTKTHDVSLDLRAKQVLVWASSTAIVEEVQNALELGLETKLLPRTPQQMLGPVALEKLSPTPELFGSAS
ncbi:MAG: recombination-associated protein RdgC [Myxococcaceae bacterium]|nr:recombination-associated protein RdgC [Myxococcaceae bacterium]